MCVFCRMIFSFLRRFYRELPMAYLFFSWPDSPQRESESYDNDIVCIKWIDGSKGFLELRDWGAERWMVGWMDGWMDERNVSHEEEKFSLGNEKKK
ncbi:hypothetical protein DM02DRAFT_93456 [Periconia macrospinosa]|uniref:Uncharacterized protein n=1 Tax=Periconia macrospinosa TaxID=97972 RepID=A0A2V1DGD4_9PLEO|nr:hypothetical protein DM02DRAFT_93456 [Periconia macrospinosa]